MLNNHNARLGVSLWLLAMSGVVLMLSTMLPQLLTNTPQQIPLGIAFAASFLQSGLMLALAVWAGISLGKPLGLEAPVIEAALTGTGAWRQLRRQCIPATATGAGVGVLLVLAPSVAPVEVIDAAHTISIPVAAKVLYGAITEEVLIRWGLMTVMIWLPWRVWQRKSGAPKRSYVVSAVMLSAVLFGVGHLPAAMAMGIQLTTPVIAYIVIGNTLPGILFGMLYWRYGIEAAMVAHALGHIIATAAASA